MTSRVMYYPHNYALIGLITIENFEVVEPLCIMVAQLMAYFGIHMKIWNQGQTQPHEVCFSGFTRQVLLVKDLLIDYIILNFLIVKFPSFYVIIINNSILNALRMVVTNHLMMKFQAKQAFLLGFPMRMEVEINGP